MEKLKRFGLKGMGRVLGFGSAKKSSGEESDGSENETESASTSAAPTPIKTPVKTPVARVFSKVSSIFLLCTHRHILHVF